MKVSTFGKATAGLAAAATMGFGLVVPAAHAAGTALTATQEDPTTSTNLSGAPIGPKTLVGVGSDTIQDVEYGLSQDFGKLTDGSSYMASWTATGTTAMTYRSGGAPATPTAHPNGSGAGFTALKESLGVVPAGADGVAAGDVNYSRASGFQGNELTGGAGVVTEIPFAVDTISFAAPANSPFTKTNGGHGLTLADLANIYLGNDNEVDTTTGALAKSTSTSAPDAGSVFIQAYLPKPGSGSRQFFLKGLNAVNSGVQLGTNKGDSFQTTNGTPTASGAYIGNTDIAGKPVQEHDATAILEPSSASVATLTPFSGAKFIGYHNASIADPSGKVAGTDYVLVPFDSAVGGTAHSVLPYTGTTTFAPNPAYKTDGVEGKAKLTREVFHIVPTRAIQNPANSPVDQVLNTTFAGATSKVCSDTATIQAYGFLVDANCGNTTRTANSGGADTGTGYSTATVTVTHTAAVAGRSVVFTVNVSSNSNGGGKVSLTVNGKVYTGTIAKGATSTKVEVPTPTAGRFTYGAGADDGFMPNLDGVAQAPINTNPSVPLTFDVAKAGAVVVARAPRVSHLRIGAVTVQVKASGLRPTGRVNVWIKTRTGATKVSLPARALVGTTGAVKISLGKKLPKGTYYVWVSYGGNANINATRPTRLAVLSVV